jgi:hypothetical protein
MLFGRFARVSHFKHRAGTDSDSLKHRFSGEGENCAGLNFPRQEWGRQILPGVGNFCRVKPAIYSAF